MALVNTVASSAPTIATAKHRSTTGSIVMSPGAANHSPAQPTMSKTEKPAIHGLRGWPASEIAPNTGARSAAISSAMPVA